LINAVTVFIIRDRFACFFPTTLRLPSHSYDCSESVFN